MYASSAKIMNIEPPSPLFPLAVASYIPRMTVDTNTIDGSKDYNSAEIKKALFDNNSKTKFLTNENVPSKEEPIWISFALSEAKAISSYKIVSANDASGRDPSSWVFYGSKDGQTWVALDTRNGVLFTDRYQDQAFSFNNEEEYTYYKLAITANKDSGQMTQFADFFVGVSNDNQLQGVKNYDVVWSSVDGKVSFADMTTEDMDRSMTAMRLTFLDSGKTTIRVTLKEDTSIYAEYTLDVLADSTDLESLLSDAEGVEKDKYTAESYEALQSAIAAAKKVLDDEDALQSEINAVAEALELAMDALEEVADNNGATDEGDDKDNGDDKDTPGSVDTGDVYPYFAIALLLVSLTALLITKVRRKAE